MGHYGKTYTGKEKCLGCGRPGSEKERYSAKELCEDCKEALNIGQSVIKHRTELRPENFVYVSFRTVWRMFKTKDIKFRGKQDDVLDKLILHLLRSFQIFGTGFNRATPGIKVVNTHDSTSCAYFTGVMKKRDWEAIAKFVQDFEQFSNDYIGDVNERVEKAYNEGKNLLLQLASESSFLDQLNEAESRQKLK